MTHIAFVTNAAWFVSRRMLLATLLLAAMHGSMLANGYTWKPVIAGGGGFIPGIICHPAAPGLAYARTDMGGAYRWDNAAGVWIPLTDMMVRDNADYMGILSIAVDPNDTNRVYMECGKYTQSWAGNGAVLSSTNRGDTWTVVPLSVKIGGNEDGRGAGERLQVDPNLGSTLFMGTTANGLWKSTNYGATWVRVTSFTPSNVNFVVFDPSSAVAGNATQRIFAAAVNTTALSLYRSDDGGATWNPVPGQPNGLMGIRAAIADTLLYITCSNHQGPNGASAGSVWKHGILSGSWTNISPSSGSYGFSGLSVYEANTSILMVSTLDRWSPRDEVYRSTNGGASWTTCLTTGMLDYSYAPYTAGVTPHWIAALVIDPFDSSKAMFGTGYGIWASDDLAAATPTWYFKTRHLEEIVPIQIVSPPFTNLLSVMPDYDGFRHDNLDVSPPDRYSPYRGSTMSIAYAGKLPSKLVKAYNTPAPFGALSRDGGATWTDFTVRPKNTTAGGTWSIAISADGGSIVWGPAGASMSYSTSDGRGWTACGGGVPLVPPVADRVDPLAFYAYEGVSGRMWVSRDGGKMFSVGLSGLPTVASWATQDGNATAVPDHAGDVWVCCASGGLYRSTDYCGTALKVNSATEAYRLGFGRAQSDGGYPAVYLFGKVNGALGFYRSDDTGATWVRINDDARQYGWVHQISGDLRVYGRCYVAAEGRGIHYGEPAGGLPPDNPSTFKFLTVRRDSLRQQYQSVTVNWLPATDPHGAPLTYQLHFFGSNVDTSFSTSDTTATFSVGPIQAMGSYVLTGIVSQGDNWTASSNHVSFYAAGTLTGVEDSPFGIPEATRLMHNYPNPFNPTTSMRYSVGVVGREGLVATKVRLVVYDVLGREVAVLVDEKKAPGTYQVEFDGAELSSGMYFYRLSAGEYVETHRMLLLK